jgi:hypothetical protein
VRYLRFPPRESSCASGVPTIDYQRAIDGHTCCGTAKPHDLGSWFFPTIDSPDWKRFLSRRCAFRLSC